MKTQISIQVKNDNWMSRCLSVYMRFVLFVKEMSKMKKRHILFVVFMVIMLMSLTACSSNDDAQAKISNINSGEAGNIETVKGYDDVQTSEQDAQNIVFVPDDVKLPGIWEVLPEIPVNDVGEFKYELSSELGGIIVTNYLGDKTEVRIPDTFDGEPVVKVDLTKCKKALTEIILPDSVKSYELTDDTKLALQYINIPAGITEIGDYEFNGWSSLRAVYIPDGISVIGKFAINNCQSLENIILPGSLASIGSSSLVNCTSLTEIRAVNGDGNYCSRDGILYEKTENGGISLRKCPTGKAGSIVIPNGVTEIYKYAFDYCQKITDITIPGTTTVIGQKAFCDCISLTNVTLSEGIVELGEDSFKECTALTGVTIPDSVTKIDEAFYGCTNIQATYKGKIYDYEHIEDLYKAINDN